MDLQLDPFNRDARNDGAIHEHEGRIIALLLRHNPTVLLSVVLLVLAGGQAAPHTAILIGAVGLMVLQLPRGCNERGQSTIVRIASLADLALRGPAAMALVKAIAFYMFGFAVMLAVSSG